MVKRVCCLGVAVVGILVLSGCTTARKNDDLLNQGLRNKVLALEAQLNEKDSQINSLKEELLKNEQVGVESVAGDTKLSVDPKQVQTALKNAGFYQGAVDGKLGKKTRRAIRAFQRANNLHADGKVGSKTWDVLKEYLDKKVK